jgi:signal transduction histidine kinase
MKSYRLSTIGLVACAALVATLVATTFGVDGADAQWQSPFGLAVRRAAEAFTPPPSWDSAGTDRARLSRQLYLVGYAASGVLFTTLFWLRTRATARRPAWRDAVLLGVQMALGLAVEANLLYLFAAELAIVLAPRRAAGWLAAMIAGHVVQSLAIVAATASSDLAARYQLMNVVEEVVFHLFAFGVATLATLEQRTRLHLAASHAELLATQALLADAVRTSERLRIARDLHDSIGHHLTALKLHLELADRQLAGGNASLRTARELSSELLGQVRQVVSAERDDPAVDLLQSLRTLCDGIPAPAIRLEVAGDLRAASAMTAHALFRCIQEAISNALRHAQARAIAVSVARRDASFVAVVRDDGRGAHGRAEGNGLAGMRERVQALGGRLRVGDAPGGGFQVELSLPAAEAAR